VKNDHHVFPKDILKACFYRDDINTILNICFLTFGENIKIKNKPPWIYLSEFKENSNFKKVLDSHVLPFKECLLKKGGINEKYQAFKKERMVIIKHDLTRLMRNSVLMNLFYCSLCSLNSKARLNFEFLGFAHRCTNGKRD